jgi:hypothetical protein
MMMNSGYKLQSVLKLEAERKSGKKKGRKLGEENGKNLEAQHGGLYILVLMRNLVFGLFSPFLIYL